jgi:hypothetical protein
MHETLEEHRCDATDAIKFRQSENGQERLPACAIKHAQVCLHDPLLHIEECHLTISYCKLSVFRCIIFDYLQVESSMKVHNREIA